LIELILVGIIVIMGCGELIPKGSLRVAVNLGTGNYPNHYKIEHFAKKYAKQIVEIYLVLTDKERNSMSRDDQP